MNKRYNYDDLGLLHPDIPENVIGQVETNLPPDEQNFESSEREKLKPARKPDVLGPDLTTEKLFVKDTGKEQVGQGLYAKKDINVGEHVFEFTGIQRAEKFHPLAARDGYSAHSIVVGHDSGTFFVYATPNKLSPLRYLNHSCNPNIGRLSNDLFGFVALKPIRPGEELTADYSLLEVNPYWEMDNCGCGSDNCRHKIGSASALPAEYLQANWQRLTPEMQVTALQFSRDEKITEVRNKLGTDYMFQRQDPLTKRYSYEDILTSTLPAVVGRRNAFGAKEFAKTFLEQGLDRVKLAA